MIVETKRSKIRSYMFRVVPVLSASWLFLAGCVGMKHHAPASLSGAESPPATLSGKSARSTSQPSETGISTGKNLTPQDLTLNDAIRSALANNPGLQAARKRIDAAAGREAQMRLWPNPELELSSEEFPPRDGGFSSAQNLVGISQTVPFPGKKSLDARIGRKGMAVAEFEYLGREIGLVRDVKTEFIAALAAEKKIAATEQQLVSELSIVDSRLRAAAEQVERYRTRILPNAEKALKMVQGGFNAGKFGFLDLVDTQRVLAESRFTYYEKLYELNAARAALEALLLKDPHLPLSVEQPNQKSKSKE